MMVFPRQYIYVYGQSSTHELVFGYELGPSLIWYQSQIEESPAYDFSHKQFPTYVACTSGPYCCGISEMLGLGCFHWTVSHQFVLVFKLIVRLGIIDRVIHLIQKLMFYRICCFLKL